MHFTCRACLCYEHHARPSVTTKNGGCTSHPSICHVGGLWSHSATKSGNRHVTGKVGVLVTSLPKTTQIIMWSQKCGVLHFGGIQRRACRTISAPAELFIADCDTEICSNSIDSIRCRFVACNLLRTHSGFVETWRFVVDALWSLVVRQVVQQICNESNQWSVSIVLRVCVWSVGERQSGGLWCEEEAGQLDASRRTVHRSDTAERGVPCRGQPAVRGFDPYRTGGTCPPNIYEGGHPW